MGKKWVHLLILAAITCQLSAESLFQSKPQLIKTKTGCEISFELKKATDVEISILDKDKNTIRNLVAGFVGGEKSVLPLSNSLKQKVVWDGKDNFQKPASNAPFFLRIRAGSDFIFNKYIGSDPYTFGAPVSLQSDESGNLYILANEGSKNQNMKILRKFDAEGNYLKTIMPFPANLEQDAMKDVAKWNDDSKSFMPRNLSSLNPEFYTNNSIELVHVSEKDGLLLADNSRIYRINQDGSIKDSKFISKVCWDKKDMPWGNVPMASGKARFCVSIDGQYLYFTGQYNQGDRFKNNPRYLPGNIYRVNLNDDSFYQEYLTISVDHKDGIGGQYVKTMGYGDYQNDPTHGIQEDQMGNLYVCDRENDRISIYNSKKELCGKAEIPFADQVLIHPKNGEIYVLQAARVKYQEYHSKLVKFSKLSGNIKSIAEYKFPSNSRYPKICLTIKDKQTFVWMSDASGNVLCLEDLGEEFQIKKTKLTPKKNAQISWNRIALDYEKEVIYSSNGGNTFWKYDGNTGEGGILKKDEKIFEGVDLSVGYDGYLYVRTGSSYSGPLERLDRNLDPAPYPETKTHFLNKYIYSRYGVGNCEKGLGVGPKGEVYISFMYDWTKYFVAGFGGDGKPIQGNQLLDKIKPNVEKGANPDLLSAVIGPVPGDSGGIRVDWQGNIYIGVRNLPENFVCDKNYLKDQAYHSFSGSVVKFTKTGGTFLGIADSPSENDIKQKISLNKKMFAGDAIDIYPGLAPMSGGGYGGNTSNCVCRVPRFDLDRFGRIAIPNCVTNSVKILDNAGNQIKEIGGYGNFDSLWVLEGEEEAKIKTPKIPLGWPIGVGFTEKSLYIMDVINRRIVRVDFIYEAEEVLAIH